MPDEVAVSAPAVPAAIQRPYLMVMYIPYFEDDQGHVHLERLWHRDFLRHLLYLKELTLIAPRRHIAEAQGVDLVRLDVPAGCAVRFRELPRQESRVRALLEVVNTARAVWSAVGDAEIVHAGIVGWPYPVGWLAGPIAMLRNKRLLVVVESAPWRLTSDAPKSIIKRAESVLYERLGRFIVNRAHLSFFTQPSYRDTLRTSAKNPGFIIPASWINEDDVINEAVASEAWRKKHEQPRVRLLFAGRLTHDKGVDSLLSALALLQEQDVLLDVDIIGEGELRERCVAAATSLSREAGLRVAVLDPMPYERFLTLIRSYHGVLVPSLSDEQPRIVFDAYAQAVPVIASDTDGLRPYVFDQRTGLLVKPGDVEGLAAALKRASGASHELERYGLQALAHAATITHASTHRERWRLTVEQLLSS